LSIGKDVQTSAPWNNLFSITAKRTPDSPEASGLDGAAPGRTSPSGALLSITPELIRQERILQEADIGADVKSLFAEGQAYGIGAGDVVEIVVWNHPELTLIPAGASVTPAGFNVSLDGMIQFPLIGTFKIVGLTENQARTGLTRQLSKFLKDPQVTLRVQSYRAGRIYVDGEVRTPGQQAINDIAMTLPEAISRAGGLTPTADRGAVALSRNGKTTMINMAQLVKLGVNPSRILLAPGDLVRVASRDDTKVYVMGEVTRPMALPLRNGRLTLNEALGESGGINVASGDPRQIYVVRSRSGESSGSGATAEATAPKIYHLDARSPAAYALAEGFELQSRDVVFVDPVPLVIWNRIISLVLPSAQAVTTTRAATN
jgi:polysaccharide export outer membrane protein